MKSYVPNLLSLSRIVFAPLVLFLLYVESGKAIAIFLLVFTIFLEITDALDGYTARKYNIVSDMGKVLDPFADTVLHMTLFIAFYSLGYMPMWMLLISLYRDMLSMFMRILSSMKGFSLAARFSGKLKTAARAFAVCVVLLLDILIQYGVELPYQGIRFYTFLVVTVITIYSFLDYLSILNTKQK